jgi:phage FluMu protein gp41
MSETAYVRVNGIFIEKAIYEVAMRELQAKDEEARKEAEREKQEAKRGWRWGR